MDQNFFGRTEVLESLQKRVVDLKDGYRHNVALLGPQFVGKSSILQYFLSNLDDDRVIPIYLDLESKDFTYFFTKFVGSLLYYFSKNQGLALQDDLNLLLEMTKKHIPHTVEVIQRIRQDFEKEKVTDTFLGLLTLPEIFTNETGKFCVLIIDEFQNLEDFLVPDIFQSLGKKIMTQKRCLYVVSSSFPKTAQKILSEKLSLLFGSFALVDIDCFDLDNSQKFIEHNLKEIKIGAQLRNFLTDFTGGHPLYLYLISKELIHLSAIYKQDEIYMPLLAQAVENTIFNRWGVISRHFELIMADLCGGKGQRNNSLVLMAIANGKHKLDDLVGALPMKKTNITQKINRLSEAGVVVKNGNFYYLKDRLFKYWIKYVYQIRMKDVEFSSDKQYRQFKEEFNRSIENFKISSRKDFPSRVMELLYCFDNEAFDLNGRHYKLPQFRDIIPMKFKNDSGLSLDVLKASTKDALWFIVMKKDSVLESDVNDFLKESKQIGTKPEKCLIISLSNLDENAKLRALQERIWVWNEYELNTLLTLFDKPFILR